MQRSEQYIGFLFIPVQPGFRDHWPHQDDLMFLNLLAWKGQPLQGSYFEWKTKSETWITK